MSETIGGAKASSPLETKPKGSLAIQPVYEKTVSKNTAKKESIKPETQAETTKLKKTITPKQRRDAFMKAKKQKALEKKTQSIEKAKALKQKDTLKKIKHKNTLRNKQRNALGKCGVDFSKLNTSNPKQLKKALKIAKQSKQAIRSSARLKTQADLQKLPLSKKAQASLEAQGVETKSSKVGIEGMKKIAQIEANEEFSTLLKWDQRKEYYESAREQISQLYDT